MMKHNDTQLNHYSLRRPSPPRRTLRIRFPRVPDPEASALTFQFRNETWPVEISDFFSGSIGETRRTQPAEISPAAAFYFMAI